ncbi:hypothetical protein N0V86_007809 [Didymella sp. IMI 355093]|nr:hypothetical protein N0V86_007809 [Didymella sp. IMI 355093]
MEDGKCQDEYELNINFGVEQRFVHVNFCANTNNAKLLKNDVNNCVGTSTNGDHAYARVPPGSFISARKQPITVYITNKG